MEKYQVEFARVLAETGALFFAQGLKLKDGRPTPYFVNLGLFRSGRLVSRLGSLMAGMLVSRGLAGEVDVLVGPSYKGSALAVSIAQALWTEHGRDVLFDYDRKEAKTHGEATGGRNLMVTNALFDGARVLVVDDVGTSMATKYDLMDVLKNVCRERKIEIALSGVALAMDREQTTAVYDEEGRVREGVRGEDALGRFTADTGLPVYALAGIRAVVRYLAAEQTPVLIDGESRPLDPETLDNFETYLSTYGVTGR